MSELPSRQQVLQQRWHSLGTRERQLITWAGALVLAALVWSLAIAPAWRTLSRAPQQHSQLDAELQAMREMAGQAKALQSQPRIGYDDALRLLEASVRQKLGSTAQFSVSGERALLTLKGSSPDALAQWLTQARLNARALPGEARLTRGPLGWDGSLVLLLPARP